MRRQTRLANTAKRGDESFVNRGEASVVGGGEKEAAREVADDDRVLGY